jgi:hypothetical protein
MYVLHTAWVGRPEENSISGLPIIFSTEVHNILCGVAHVIIRIFDVQM